MSRRQACCQSHLGQHVEVGVRVFDREAVVAGASHLLWLEGGEPFFQAAELILSGQWPAAAVILSP